MFSHRYFGARHFGPRYFGDGGAQVNLEPRNPIKPMAHGAIVPPANVTIEPAAHVNIIAS